MKKYLKLIMLGACMAAMVAFAAGCSTPAQDQASDKPTTVEFAGGELTYSKGDLLIMLDGNATTGYEWTSEVEGTTLKTDVDEYVAEGQTVNGAGEDVVVGLGGVHCFGYKAEGSGDAAITLKYARSWEETADDKTITVTTTVENGVFTKVDVK